MSLNVIILQSVFSFIWHWLSLLPSLLIVCCLLLLLILAYILLFIFYAANLLFFFSTWVACKSTPSIRSFLLWYFISTTNYLSATVCFKLVPPGTNTKPKKADDLFFFFSCNSCCSCHLHLKPVFGGIGTT